MCIACIDIWQNFVLNRKTNLYQVSCLVLQSHKYVYHHFTHSDISSQCRCFLLLFFLQVLLVHGSSPFTRLMPAPTTCPKPTPGEKLNIYNNLWCDTHFSAFYHLCVSGDHDFKVHSPSFFPSFNRIDIPPYEHYDKLYDKLLTAIEETCGFAVEWVVDAWGRAPQQPEATRFS